MQNFPSRSLAEKLDQDDPLAHYRDHFNLPEGVTYMVGHSLGPTSNEAIQSVQNCLGSEWKDGLVGSWNSSGWFDMAKALGAPLAKLIGALPHEVMVTDTVSVNLFKLAIAAKPLCENHEIIYVDEFEFPTDQYMADSVATFQKQACVRVGTNAQNQALRSGGIYIKSAVNYRTSELVDIAAYETVAQKAGSVIIWDLSHATGVIDLQLKAKGARLATGCTYKYLNAGPGAPAFLSVDETILPKMMTPLPGWMGHARPFAFEKSYEPTDDTSRFASGTPPILSLSALKGALEIYEHVNVSDLQRKVQKLGAFAIELADHLGLDIESPRINDVRGGHISLSVDNGYAVSRALYARGFHTDFRTPSTIRLGLSPLYIRFQDVWDVMSEMGRVLETRSWDKPEFKTRQKVT